MVSAKWWPSCLSLNVLNYNSLWLTIFVTWAVTVSLKLNIPWPELSFRPELDKYAWELVSLLDADVSTPHPSWNSTIPVSRHLGRCMWGAYFPYGTSEGME